MVMAAGDHHGCGRDHYQLLGVPRDASRQEIAQAWRRRARDEHPDTQPRDEDAPDRFRVLAEAWHVLSDPDQRAAYDRALAREPQPAPTVRITVRRSDAGRPAAGTPYASEAAPPLRAGPVWVDGMPAPGSWPTGAERDVMLALLAMRYLARDRRRRW